MYIEDLINIIKMEEFKKRKAIYMACLQKEEKVREKLRTLENETRKARAIFQNSCDHRWTIERMYDHKIRTCDFCAKQK